MIVLDACAILALFHNEPGADVVEAALNDPVEQCVIHAVNMCEVYYDFLKTSDEQAAQAAISDLRLAQLIVDETMDQHFWQEVARHKSAIRKISLADCFAVALTQRVGGELYTSDHGEFDPVAQQGICRVRFIR